MVIYTGNISDIMAIDGYENNNNRIEVCTDGAGVKFITQEVIEYPLFADLKKHFDNLQPIEYTPHGEPSRTN
jgi:hypothetical protein